MTIVEQLMEELIQDPIKFQKKSVTYLLFEHVITSMFYKLEILTSNFKITEEYSNYVYLKILFQSDAVKLHNDRSINLIDIIIENISLEITDELNHVQTEDIALK